MIKLPRRAYEWALKHLSLEGDSDLFPSPFEIDAIAYNKDTVIAALGDLDIGSHQWTEGRRFVVPKGNLGFRSATQLDPIDSIVLAAIIFTYGSAIEAHRLPKNCNRAFSYRFEPTVNGQLYGTRSSWHSFWQNCKDTASAGNIECVAIGDVADFYNQIYHHALEQQMLSAHVPNEIVNSILNLLKRHTQRVSRGIPVGPHSTHILAELAFHPIDQSLLDRGLDFRRSVDDVHFFCKTREEAEIALYKFADVLDRQQRLTVQNTKTEIVSLTDYVRKTDGMLIDRPLNEDEQQILNAIARAAGGPYSETSLDALTDQELKHFDKGNLENLFSLYLSQTSVPYVRLGWLLRRLAQVGAPGAVDYVIEHITEFTPILGDVSRYLLNASTNYSGDWPRTGERVIDVLALPIVRSSPYVQISLLHLFGALPALDHLTRLTATYDSAAPELKREIVSAAAAASRADWIRERKCDFGNADPWLRRAIVAASKCLPGDEASVWLRSNTGRMTFLEKIVARWAFGNATMNVGQIRLC